MLENFKTPKPTHCWSCENKFNLLTGHALKCAGPDCRRTICRECVAITTIFHEKLRFCPLCFSYIYSPPTRRSAPHRKTPTSARANTLSSPTLSPVKLTTNGEAKETRILKIETPAPPQVLSMEEQVAQQREIIKHMEALMMNSRRRQGPATDPPALLVVPKDQSIQPVQAATQRRPSPHQDSRECKNFKHHPIESVDSFAVSASHAYTKPQRKTSRSATASKVYHKTDNSKIAPPESTSGPRKTNNSFHHGTTGLSRKITSAEVPSRVTRASNRSQRKSRNRQKSQRCRPDDVQTSGAANRVPKTKASSNNHSTPGGSTFTREQRRAIAQQNVHYRARMKPNRLPFTVSDVEFNISQQRELLQLFQACMVNTTRQ
ncbi:hypothetical protein AC1031_006510 [Aphanomyces cochlioides]|nr:hypothetical protein AC1031_006510 [Aphanomyces cochlioides]